MFTDITHVKQSEARLQHLAHHDVLTGLPQLRAPCELSCGQSVYLGCGVGISVYPADSGDHHQLIKYADTALYRAKDNGRGTYHFYAEVLVAEADARLALESSLQRALQLPAAAEGIDRRRAASLDMARFGAKMEAQLSPPPTTGEFNDNRNRVRHAEDG